jgi:hypothetical protein
LPAQERYGDPRHAPVLSPDGNHLVVPSPASRHTTYVAGVPSCSTHADQPDIESGSASDSNAPVGFASTLQIVHTCALSVRTSPGPSPRHGLPRWPGLPRTAEGIDDATVCGLDDHVWRSRSGIVLTRPVRARCPLGRCNRSDAGVSLVTVGQQRAPVPAIGFGPRYSPKRDPRLQARRTCPRRRHPAVLKEETSEPRRG